MRRRKISTKPDCCSLKSLKTADDCPFGLGCLIGLDCNYKKDKIKHSNGANKPKQRRNPKKMSCLNKHKKKR